MNDKLTSYRIDDNQSHRTTSRATKEEVQEVHRRNGCQSEQEKAKEHDSQPTVPRICRHLETSKANENDEYWNQVVEKIPG